MEIMRFITNGQLIMVQPDTRLTDEPANSYGPAITVSGLYVHIAWRDLTRIIHTIFGKFRSNAILERIYAVFQAQNF
jgi:hypothetical protein